MNQVTDNELLRSVFQASQAIKNLAKLRRLPRLSPSGL